MAKLLDRVADAGGLLYVLCTFSGYALLVAPRLPESLDSPDAVLAHMQAHPPTTGLWAGIWLEAGGLAALVLLAARIASRLGAVRPGWWLPTAAVGLAVAAFTVKLGSFPLAFAALETTRYDAGTVTALLAVNDAAVPVAGALDGAFVLLLGLGALAVRALPRWLSVSAVLAGAGVLLSTAVPAVGLLHLGLLLWLLSASGWLLFRGGSRVAVVSR